VDKTVGFVHGLGQAFDNGLMPAVSKLTGALGGFAAGVVKVFNALAASLHLPAIHMPGVSAPAQARRTPLIGSVSADVESTPSTPPVQTPVTGTSGFTTSFGGNSEGAVPMIAPTQNMMTQGMGGFTGFLSAKYESGNPFQAGGDNGHAFGSWQFDRRYGLKGLMAYLAKNDPAVYARLQGKDPATQEFRDAWKGLSSIISAKDFKAEQLKFAKSAYLDPLLKGFGHRLDDPALQEAAFSTAIHHGVPGASHLLKEAGIMHGVAGKELISNLYDQRDIATSGKFHTRFTHEKNDALIAEQNQLLREQNAHLSKLVQNTDEHKNLAKEAIQKNDAHNQTMNRIARSAPTAAAAKAAQLNDKAQVGVL
jgi:hypothetical protein